MTNERSKQATWRVVLDTVATVAFIAVAGTFVWTALVSRSPVTAAARVAAPLPRPRPELPLPSEPISLTGAATQGNALAHVALIEYSDFQCPFCGKFAREVFPDIVKQYVARGKVLVAFREMPLPIHSFAEKAAEATECAGRQGQFWSFHDLLFNNQQQLDQANLLKNADSLKLNRSQFESCLSGAEAAHVNADVIAAGTLGVGGTPTFFLGLVQSDGRLKVTKRLTGAQPLAQFQAVLDPMISANPPTANAGK